MGVDELRTQDQVNPVEKADNPNSIVDKDEIGRIEAVGKDVENSEKNEKMKGFIEKESKDELNNIKSQCLNVINAFDGSEGKKEEAAQAILSLLRINQILGKVKISGGTPIDLKGNCFDQLVALVGTKGIDFKTVLGNDEGEIVNAACKKAEGLLNKPSEEDQKKIDTWEQSKDDISYLKGISDGLTGQGVNSAFLELRNNLNAKGNEAEREKFEGAVFALIKKCCPQIDGVGSLDKKFYSDKIKEFQQAVLDKSKEEGVADEYKTAWSELSNDIKPVERAIDGKLGRNTLNSLVAFATKGLKFEPKPVEKTDGSAKFEGGKEKIETGNLLERMPTVFAAFKKYGELTEKKGYQIFSFNNEPGKSDFVMKESGTGDEYIKIGGKKFYINLEQGAGGDKLQFRNKHVQREMYGDVQKTTDLCFGKFDQKGNLVEGSKITIDSEGRQISSLIMTDTEVKDTEGKSMGKLGLRTMGGKEGKVSNEKGEETVTQDVKWRIDIFGEDGKDTKRMSDEQLDALMKDKEAVKVVLDLAINAFKDTMHKPSTIGRYNLNSIISRILTDLPEDAQKKLVDVTHNTGYLESGMSRKERVASFLRLEHGLFSDPENKINKNDLDAGQRDTYSKLKTNAEKREFRSKLKQGDRIISRLELLKKALEGKTDNIPADPAIVTTETGGDEEEGVETAIGRIKAGDQAVRSVIGGKGEVVEDIPEDNRGDEEEGVETAIGRIKAGDQAVRSVIGGKGEVVEDIPEDNRGDEEEGVETAIGRIKVGDQAVRSVIGGTGEVVREGNTDEKVDYNLLNISSDEYEALSLEDKVKWAKNFVKADIYSNYNGLPIKKLDVEVAKVLKNKNDGLNFSQLTELDDKSAKEFSDYKYSLNFSGVKELSSDALKSLFKPIGGGSYYKGKEITLGITRLSEGDSKIIAGGNCESIAFTNLDSISDGVAENLSNIPGNIDLRSIKSLNETQAKYLARHGRDGNGNLTFQNLTNISDEAADALTYHNPLGLIYSHCSREVYDKIAGYVSKKRELSLTNEALHGSVTHAKLKDDYRKKHDKIMRG